MKGIYIYVVLFLFCSVSTVAQEVAFEGVHLEDFISVPDRSSSTRTFALPASSLKLNELKTFRLNKPLDFYRSRPSFPDIASMRPPQTDALRSYRLTDKLSLHLSTNDIAGRNRSLRNLYTMGAGGGLIWELSDHFYLKGGVCYQYNIGLQRWEWSYQAGFIFRF